jgi:LuxR family maltose regulon positive regulatory protein
LSVSVMQPGRSNDSHRRGRLIPRRALFERLAGAARVIFVSAPAGSGKTSLVRSWIADAGLTECAAWVSVGPEGRDPQAFWLSVVDSLRGTTGSAADPEPPVSTSASAQAVENWAFAARLRAMSIASRAHLSPTPHEASGSSGG